MLLLSCGLVIHIKYTIHNKIEAVSFRSNISPNAKGMLSTVICQGKIFGLFAAVCQGKFFGLLAAPKSVEEHKLPATKIVRNLYPGGPPALSVTYRSIAE